MNENNQTKSERENNINEERMNKTKKMECYATPWQLWRESRNLLIFTEPSYTEKAPLSLYL